MEHGAFKWTYDRATGRFICGGPYDPPCDPATQAIARFDRNPDPRTERFDAEAPDHKRPATQAEIDAYDAGQVADRETAAFDELKIVKAVVRWICQREGIQPVVARQEIMAIYRNL